MAPRLCFVSHDVDISEACRPVILQSVPCYGRVCFLPLRVHVGLRVQAKSFLLDASQRTAHDRSLSGSCRRWLWFRRRPPGFRTTTLSALLPGFQAACPGETLWVYRPRVAPTWIHCYSDGHETVILTLTQLCPSPSVIDVLLASAFILLALVPLWCGERTAGPLPATSWIGLLFKRGYLFVYYLFSLVFIWLVLALVFLCSPYLKRSLLFSVFFSALFFFITLV